MKKLTALYLAIMIIILSAVIGCSAPKPIPGKSHFSMARVLYDDSVSIKAGETKSFDVTLETRKQGPGKVIYEISRVAGEYSGNKLPLPAGLDVSIEPSQFMAYPETVYHSTITIKTTPELTPGEYWLSFGKNFEKVFSGAGWIKVNVESMSSP